MNIGRQADGQFPWLEGAQHEHKKTSRWPGFLDWREYSVNIGRQVDGQDKKEHSMNIGRQVDGQVSLVRGSTA